MGAMTVGIERVEVGVQVVERVLKIAGLEAFAQAEAPEKRSADGPADTIGGGSEDHDREAHRPLEGREPVVGVARLLGCLDGHQESVPVLLDLRLLFGTELLIVFAVVLLVVLFVRVPLVVITGEVPAGEPPAVDRRGRYRGTDALDASRRRGAAVAG